MASLSYKHFTLGVEEEYMVIDPVSKELKSREQKIVQVGQLTLKDKVKAEMHQAVVEVGTDICADVDEAHKDVALLRKTISGIADTLGFAMGASGTHPFSHWERKVFTDAGFGPGYQVPGLPHRTGHGLGLDIHEVPYIVGGNSTPLEAGMCFCIEPMLCVYGECGVRLEDIVYMTHSGPRWFLPPAERLDDPFDSTEIGT